MSTYVVTGASRGLGLEFVRQILQKPGARVFACCRNPSSATALEELKQEAGDRLSVHKLDVNNKGSIEESAKEISKLTGGGIDVLINNAGISKDNAGLTKITKAELEEMFTTNVTGPVLVAQQFIPLLELGGKKQIINVSSILGSITLNINSASTMGYGVTKAALNMVTSGFSKELKDQNITVISIHPGWVQTDMGGKGADITSDESISGMLKVIDGLTFSSTGKYFDYAGKELPW
ncbi:NAD(P)-binding protein [Basidiobolus meristosporus CBS 931.73]|uniref:NAD(P)-binding protein n=1 Tax=Basidiobolus meristosporus CBS 931.73 TaxID=1314790 RepID=A0A1Y1Z4X9_9FUNG|nr:NAD(P)-binding protein [Basidiobolus meristosporus CBS 931.73]|eukprot:ORY05310.1 NAD(P)-binding protein [Basidiobolus meristosporus CBS 931.73]